MAKLNQRLAYYADGNIEVGKTTRKTFDTNGLVGVVSFYEDGSRELEALKDSKEPTDEVVNSKEYFLAQARLKSVQGFKSDGGLTAEDLAILKERKVV